MISGRIWKFGDNINTDFIMPGPALYLPEKERVRYVFQANRPGWVDLVQPGDLIIAGHNFGVGCSRPAALSLTNLRIGCLIAESINGLFFRNAVSFGLPAMECAGVSAEFEEGDEAEVDFPTATVRNRRTGRILAAVAVPPELADLMLGGGMFPLLEKQGLILPLSASGS